MLKYTSSTLKKLENLVREGGYILRYEKGNFRSGYCLLEEKKVVVVNRYHPLDAKINTLMDIIKELAIDEDALSEDSQTLFGQLDKQSESV